MALSTFLRPSRAVPGAVLLLLLLMPVYAAVADAPFYLTLFARILVYAIAANALNLALGLGGMVGFGHALFMGLGAYSVALPAHFGLHDGLAQLGIALAVCGLAGLLTGAISLRTSGIAFIMITLAFSQMGYFAFVSLKQFGGDDGMPVQTTSRLFGWDLGSTPVLYIAAMAVLLLLLAWTAQLRNAPFGMALRATRQNARRVGALGLPQLHYRLTAYVLSAMLCGVAGFLLANLTAFATPGMMSWQISGELIVMVVLGGMGTVAGPLLGALAFLGLEEAMKAFTEHWAAVFGPLIVVVALSGKAGIAGLLAWLDGWLLHALRRPPDAASPASATATAAAPAGLS